jgi:hypothetical protein
MSRKQRRAETIPNPNTTHTISSCPYCGSVCSLDNDAKELLFVPEGEGGKPCKHTAFVAVCLEARGARGRDAERSCWLLWGHGEGLRRMDFAGPRVRLDGYIEQLALDAQWGLDAWRAAGGRDKVRSRFVFLPPELWPRGVEFKVSGGTATARNETHPGSGTFALTDRRGKTLQAGLDAWGIYSPDPARMAALVRRLASQ